MADTGDKRLELAMGHLLRAGVTLAAAVVLAGGAIYLILAPSATANYREFHGAAHASWSLPSILAGVSHLNSESIMALGILLLIATPVCRVLMGAVGFLAERDWLYTAVSVLVLAILLVSLFSVR